VEVFEVFPIITKFPAKLSHTDFQSPQTFFTSQTLSRSEVLRVTQILWKFFELSPEKYCGSSETLRVVGFAHEVCAGREV
jgi:hypothetical protein